VLTMEWISILCMSGGIFLAAACQGLVGFGFGLLSIPVLASFMEIKGAIIIAVALTFLHYLLITGRDHKNLKFKNTLLLLIGCLTGMVMGVWIFVNIDQTTLKFVAGVTIAASGLLLFFGWFPRLSQAGYIKIIVGALGGVLQTMAGMGGPPVVIYLASQNLKPTDFRSIVITLFLVMSGTSFFILSLTGVASYSLMIQGAILLPSLIVGHEVGLKLVRVVNHRLFRLIVHLLIVGTGFSLIADALLHSL